MFFKSLLFFLFYLFTILSLWAEKKIDYYLLHIKNIPSGYIRLESFEENSDGTRVEVRKVLTALKTEIGRADCNFYVLEQTRTTGATISYSLERSLQREILSRQEYRIDGNSITVHFFSKNGKEEGKQTFSLPQYECILGDYFSLLSVVQKAQKYPIQLSVIDLKTISPQSKTIPAEKLALQSLGKSPLSLGGKTHNTLLFTFPSAKSLLHIWATPDFQKILQIQDDKGDLKIVLAEEKEIQALEQTAQKSFFAKIRDFPFALNQNYEYVFTLDKKKVGELSFSCEKTPLGGYKIYAKINLSHEDQVYSAETQTTYDENLLPSFYAMQDNKGYDIICEFLEKGVKEKMKIKENIIEYLVPLSPDFILVDNNAIHHIAMLLPRCPLEVGKTFSFSIFHPRRMRSSEASVSVLKKTEKYFILELTTPFYKTKIWVNEKGRLVRYLQGKLEVLLHIKEKKDK